MNNTGMRTETRHHHHHHHQDASDIYKQNQFHARRRHWIISNVLFTLGCILSVLIIIAVVWLYTNE